MATLVLPAGHTRRARSVGCLGGTFVGNAFLCFLSLSLGFAGLLVLLHSAATTHARQNVGFPRWRKACPDRWRGRGVRRGAMARSIAFRDLARVQRRPPATVLVARYPAAGTPT